MALIKCHECGAEISKSAKVCPQCGAKNKGKSSLGCALIFLFVVLPVGGAVMEVAGKAREEGRLASLSPEQRVLEIQNAPKKKQAEQDWKDSWGAIYGCRATLEESLNDPDSVKYRDAVEATPFAKDKNGVFTVTIGLRAKNAFGAMMPAIYICSAKQDGDSWVVQKLTTIPTP
jgi:hypothetical protein